jgi:hypothetical protein
VLRVLAAICVLSACKVEPVRAPSYFDNAYKNQPKPPTCRDMLACYPQCMPLTEECQATCEQRGAPIDAEHARAAESCFASSGCADDTCMKERCSAELAACG